MKNRFRVEIIKKDLNPEENKKCTNLINALQEKTKLININDQVYTCNLSDSLALLYTVHFANQLKMFSQYFKSIRCYDIVSGKEKVFI